MALVEHLEKLRYFKRLVEFKSMTEAASAIGITQAGLSKSIASLESALDTKLFVRSADGLILTREGEITLEVANRIIKDVNGLENQLRNLKYPSSPKVFRIGMYDSIAVYFYSALSEHLKAIYPNVELLLTVAPSPELAGLIEKRLLDLAIGANLKSLRILNAESFHLFEDCYDVFVSTNKTISEIEKVLLIHPNAMASEGAKAGGSFLIGELRKLNAHHVFNFETIKLLTTQGHGYGVMPVRVARPMVMEGKLKLLRLTKKQRAFGVHEIGFLAEKGFQAKHREFTNDIFRLGKKWSELPT